MTVYVSNYKHWKTEFWKKGNAESSITGTTTSSSQFSKRFTDNSKGSGWYGGWSNQGLEFYNKVMNILNEQQQGDDCDPFEKKVQYVIINGWHKNRKKRTRDGQTKAMNNISNLENILRL